MKMIETKRAAIHQLAAENAVLLRQRYAHEKRCAGAHPTILNELSNGKNNDK